ncbi:hypothetical protein FQN54_002263 [Arachnomyces sp. PD_36]|nr:hypothetical protein FQN54_002263 [Arachnomyces sp. PD_36]
MAGEEIQSVQSYRFLARELLEKAAEAKQDLDIEPPLTDADLGETLWRVQKIKDGVAGGKNQQAQYAAVETAFREKFYDLLATTSIDEPEFIQIWNLLDIVSIFSDNEQCEPGLIFWLIEELLDSQTIDGCRKVFDYLESRRERNTAKHFKQKSLIILRSCNELLRRLSRAEDTVFCGRVFIFLFQSFPLGDKSSVNLRGEFHTENVTTFDEKTGAPEATDSAMDVDSNEPAGDAEKPEASTGEDTAKQAAGDTPKTPSLVTPSTKKDDSKQPMDMDTLYPIFWNLQANFSAPTRLFEAQHFASFKEGLEATISTFQQVRTPIGGRGAAKGQEELRRGSKRKRTGDGTEMASSFNPKYLTNRDLFELEVNDIAFRRHILVQALILLDFVLSLTPKSKSKLADLTNKSVLYGYVLNDEDAKWATRTKLAIANYLQQGLEGKFYYRMVDTVLSRDKNWVRWKAEGCPPIERPAISTDEHLSSQASAQKVCTNKRLRAAPLGSLDLKFLSDAESMASLGRLKETDRFSTPASDSFLGGIADDEFNIDMAQTPEEKEMAVNGKASKTWRTLRLASRNKLALFEKIDNGKNLDALFQSRDGAEESTKVAEEGAGTNASDPAQKENNKENMDVTQQQSETATLPSGDEKQETAENEG